MSTPKNKGWVESVVRESAHRWGVVVGDFANVSDHLHIKIRIPNRALYKKFIVSITGKIARKITGACRGNPTGPFWKGLPFTRVLKSAFENLSLKNYFQANRVQQEEGYSAREEFLKESRRRLKNLRVNRE